jgi:hypothetical protein
MTPGKPKSPKNPQQLRALLGEVMIRNTRAAADVNLPHRIAATVPVRPSEREALLYDQVSRYVARRYGPAVGGPMRSMALDLMQRQAGSSPQALGRSVARALREDGTLKSDDRRELDRRLPFDAESDNERCDLHRRCVAGEHHIKRRCQLGRIRRFTSGEPFDRSEQRVRGPALMRSGGATGH